MKCCKRLKLSLDTCLVHVQGIAGMPAHLMLQDLLDGNQARRHAQRCEVQASYLQARMSLSVGHDMQKHCFQRKKGLVVR